MVTIRLLLVAGLIRCPAGLSIHVPPIALHSQLSWVRPTTLAVGTTEGEALLRSSQATARFRSRGSVVVYRSHLAALYALYALYASLSLKGATSHWPSR